MIPMIKLFKSIIESKPLHAFIPESYNIFLHMAGLLTRIIFIQSSHRYDSDKEWKQKLILVFTKIEILTAAGTV